MNKKKTKRDDMQNIRFESCPFYDSIRRCPPIYSTVFIKVRGIHFDGTRWVYGFYFVDSTGTPKIEEGIERIDGMPGKIICQPVIVQTVGLYTGLIDKNGKEIYAGDIMKVRSLYTPEIISHIQWNTDAAGFQIMGYPCNLFVPHGLEVIGNIFENPELLNTEERI